MSKIIGIAGQLHEAAQNVASNISDRSIPLADLSEVLELLAQANSALGGIATRLKTRFDYRACEDTTLPWDVRELYGEGSPQQQNLATVHYELSGDWRQAAELLNKIDAAQRGEASARRRITPSAANQVSIAANSLADHATIPTGEDGSLTLQTLASAFHNFAVLGRRLNNECCDRADKATTPNGKASYADLANLFKTLVRHSETANRSLLAARDACQPPTRELPSSFVTEQAGRFDKAVYDLTNNSSLPRLPDFPNVMASLAYAIEAIGNVAAKWRRGYRTAAERSATAPAARTGYERLAQRFHDLGRSAGQMHLALTQAGDVAEQLRKQAGPATL